MAQFSQDKAQVGGRASQHFSGLPKRDRIEIRLTIRVGSVFFSDGWHRFRVIFLEDLAEISHMQAENTDLSHFSRRTDQLARILRIGKDDLPDKIGISRRMFYGYRSGDNRITARVWRLLEAAELKAGIDAAAEEERRLGLVSMRPPRSPRGPNAPPPDAEETARFLADYFFGYPLRQSNRMEQCLYACENGSPTEVASFLANKLLPDIQKDHESIKRFAPLYREMLGDEANVEIALEAIKMALDQVEQTEWAREDTRRVAEDEADDGYELSEAQKRYIRVKEAYEQRAARERGNTA